MAVIVLEKDEKFSHTHMSASQSHCLDGIVKMSFGDSARVLQAGEGILVPAGMNIPCTISVHRWHG